MNARSIVALSVVWFATLVTANWEAAPDVVRGAVPPRLDPFKHSDHVLRAWATAVGDTPEVFRDCRGCHRFDEQHPVSSPQQHCASCHAGSGALTVEFRRDSEDALIGFASRTRSAFQHHTHSMLECRECHAVEDVQDVEDFGMPEDIPLSTGPGQCARCHEASQAREAVGNMLWFVAAAEDEDVARAVGLDSKFQVPTDLDAYAEKLDQVFRAEGAGINALLDAGGNFTHGDHLNLSCQECHAGIKKASADDVGAVSVEARGCSDCHKKSATEAAEFADPRRRRRDAWSLGTFRHVDHFRADRVAGVCTEDAYRSIDTESCQACHVYAPERPGFDGRDFPFNGNSSRHRYQDCRLCHASAGWDTGESVDGAGKPALHGSSVGSSSSGESGVGGWLGAEQKCTLCHAFGQPDMAGNRPTAEVRRWAEKTFVFTGQTHPYITTAEGGAPDVQKDCSECHRAVVKALPTRLIQKTFRHATHLPPAGANLLARDCTGCHTSSLKSDAAGSLAADYRTYDLAACAACHKGSAIRQETGGQEQPEPSSVVAFPHGPHIAADLTCAQCHERGPENMSTKPGALACNECHNHVADDAGPVADYLFGDDVKSCGKCHGTKDSSAVNVPAIRGTPAVNGDARYGVEQQLFAGFRDRQFHPARSDCATCHRDNVVQVDVDGVKRDRVQAIRIKEDVLVSAARRGKYHTDRPKDILRRELRGKDGGCMSCHWKDFGTMKEAQVFPEKAGVRRNLGNEFADYPGLKSKG